MGFDYEIKRITDDCYEVIVDGAKWCKVPTMKEAVLVLSELQERYNNG